MADIRISNLPTYTADTTNAYLVMNDSGNTITYKVLKENIVGTNLTYDELTRIPQDMVWDITNEGGKVAGGLMYNYGTTNTPVVIGRLYGNTIIMEPGDTLERIEFRVPSFTSAGTINIGVYSIVERSSASGIKAYAIGDLLHTIATGHTVSSAGDNVITSINFTAQQGETKNNVYFIGYGIASGTFTIQRLGTNNLIAHIMGGNLAAGTYYRNYFNFITTTDGSLPADLSSYTINADTSPGMLFTYKTI